MSDSTPILPQPEDLVSQAPILRYFVYKHLPPFLQEVSKPLALMAAQMVLNLPAGPELTAGLRKLLEAKDCFVRAALPPQ